MSLNVKGIKIIHTINHLKKFNVKGGTSYSVANFPTIKFPDQKRAQIVSIKYALKLLFILLKFYL
jgi:hypothetical protein